MYGYTFIYVSIYICEYIYIWRESCFKIPKWEDVKPVSTLVHYRGQAGTLSRSLCLSLSLSLSCYLSLSPCIST